MSSPRPKIIIFTRLPVAGSSKTRLIPALGERGAADLQRRMTERILAWCRLLARERELDLEVRHTGSRAEAEKWLGPGVSYRPQETGDLGVRMARAFEQAFSAGAGQVLLIGCDIPALNDDVLAQGLDALQQNRLVLGPANDGGYYLVGLTRPAPEIFEDIPWGGPRVLERTLEAAQGAGLESKLLQPLADLDRPQDLALRDQAPGPPFHPGLISVIIPTFNEAPRLAGCLKSLEGASQYEVLLADGGSQDNTVGLAQEMGIKVLETGQGRGVQQKAGSLVARGEYLLFLHADTRLKPGWDQQVRLILERGQVALGAFQFKVAAPGWGFRLIEAMVFLRSRLGSLPYGDQAIFVKARTLQEIGGFPELPLMEDVELVRQARSLGRVCISRQAALSSPRRWQKHGLTRTTLANWRTLLAYGRGVDPAELEKRYYHKDS